MSTYSHEHNLAVAVYYYLVLCYPSLECYSVCNASAHQLPINLLLGVVTHHTEKNVTYHVYLRNDLRLKYDFQLNIDT